MTVRVEAEGIRKAFGGKPVLRDVHLSVEAGEVFALVGPSGSGKTTLLRIVAGLERADSGTIYLNGAEGAGSADGGVGLVMQRPAVFRRTVFDNVAFGLRLRNLDDRTIRERVAVALEEVGLGDTGHERAWTLSAGEAQRLCFARAAVLRPSLLLLDEFTANLDPANVAMLEDAVRAYHRETRATVLLVTHNLFQPKRIAQRAGLLFDGRVVETADVENFFTNPSDPRTRAFVAGEIPF